jgi:hypothetical protein
LIDSYEREVAMRFIRRALILIVMILGGVAFSQAPEFAQQYRHRLGGAIDELTVLIQDFDARANHAGLERHAALNVYAGSSQTSIRNQSEGMPRHVARYDDLTGQLTELTAASPTLRPLVLVRHFDAATFADTARDFVPAAPFSIAGAIWTAIGMTLALVAAILIAAIMHIATWPVRRGRLDRSSGLPQASSR